MSKYIDQWGRIHNKHVTKADPFPCNNSWLYSAYTAKAGIVVSVNPEVATICAIDFKRHPSVVKSDVPMSRDEILGLAYLGYIQEEIFNTWKFNPKSRPIPKFSLIKLVKQLWELSPKYINILKKDNSSYDWEEFAKDHYFELKGKGRFTRLVPHRNYFWQHNLDQLYRFAFSVPVQDRHFILKTWGKFQWFNPAHVFYAVIGKLSSFYKPNGIDWLKYGVAEKEMVKEFSEDHPIRQRLGV